MVHEGKNHLGPVPPTLTFAHVREGKTVKNRLHLDVNPTDREQDEEVRRLLDLGARHADVGQTGDESWVCRADPEGTSFASWRAAALDRRPHRADLLPRRLPTAHANTRPGTVMITWESCDCPGLGHAGSPVPAALLTRTGGLPLPGADAARG